MRALGLHGEIIRGHRGKLEKSAMKMKLVCTVFFGVECVLALLFAWAVYLPAAFAVVFGVYGVVVGSKRGLNPLNDVPNALRVLLATAGGYLVTMVGSFFAASVGILLFFGAIFLNDEYQRRALHSIRTGARGGSVAFLGIDGSGKSTHAKATGEWLRQRGYACTVMPFHRYLFVEKLATFSSGVRSGKGRRRNPLRPAVSLADNMLLQLSSSLGCRLEGRVVIYDRFIWSTYIKYEALGYPVKPLSFLYLLPRPRLALVLDVPVSKSLRVIDERVTHIHYPAAVLESERRRYLNIAERLGYPVLDATAPFESVQKEIEAALGPYFPAIGESV